MCALTGEVLREVCINSKRVEEKKRINRGNLYLLEDKKLVLEKRKNKLDFFDDFKSDEKNQLICFELKYFYVSAIGLKIDSYIEAIEFINLGWGVKAVGKIKDIKHPLYCNNEKENYVTINNVEKINGTEKYFKTGNLFFKY